MKKVEPIRSEATIALIIRQLNQRTDHQGIMMNRLFQIGIFTGLRIGDVLRLRKRDLTGDRIRIVQQKNGRRKVRDRSGHVVYDDDGNAKYEMHVSEFYIHKQLRKLVATMDDIGDDDLIFYSRHKVKKELKIPMTRTTAWRYLKEIAKIGHIDTTQTPIGTHTLRKTFGYMHYQHNHDIVLLQKWYEHSSPAITERYIGLSYEMQKNAIDKLPSFE